MRNVFVLNLTRAFKSLRNRPRQCHPFGDGVDSIDPIENALKNFLMGIICKWFKKQRNDVIQSWNTCLQPINILKLTESEYYHQTNGY